MQDGDAVGDYEAARTRTRPAPPSLRFREYNTFFNLALRFQRRTRGLYAVIILESTLIDIKCSATLIGFAKAGNSAAPPPILLYHAGLRRYIAAGCFLRLG